jgi:hypothetical protein
MKPEPSVKISVKDVDGQSLEEIRLEHGWKQSQLRISDSCVEFVKPYEDSSSEVEFTDIGFSIYPQKHKIF